MTKAAHLKPMISDYLSEHCLGYKHAQKRAQILKALPVTIGDRTFRRVLSELKHEGSAAAVSDIGVWWINLDPSSPDYEKEIDHCVESWNEMRAKAMSLLTGSSWHLNLLSQMKSRQKEMQL